MYEFNRLKLRKRADHYLSLLISLLCACPCVFQRLQGIISPHFWNWKLVCECVCECECESVCVCPSPHVFFRLGGSLVELLLALFVSLPILKTCRRTTQEDINREHYSRFCMFAARSQSDFQQQVHAVDLFFLRATVSTALSQGSQNTASSSIKTTTCCFCTLACARCKQSSFSVFVSELIGTVIGGLLIISCWKHLRS